MATSTLQLTLLMLSTTSCLVVANSVTLMEGSTLTLSCPLVNADVVSAEWQSPKGIMFFNHTKGLALKDIRYGIKELSQSMFRISVSNVTFQDGGTYKCSQYDDELKEKFFAVTVVGKVTAIKVGRTSVKCSAEGNHYPPQITWQFGNKIQMAAQPNYTYENHLKKYHSENTRTFRPLKPVRICCLVRHLQLQTEPLKDCVKITPAYTPGTPSTWHPEDEPQGTTDSPRSTTSGPQTGQSSTDAMMATIFTQASAEATTAGDAASSVGTRLDSMSVVPVTVLTDMNITLETSHNSTAGNHTQSVVPVTVLTDMNITQETSHNSTAGNGTQDAVPATVLTDKNITLDTSHNSTEGNRTQGYSEEKDKLSRDQRNASVLIFLVTCLVAALCVVVFFLAVKLRRAHIHWKRENEDSDQSVESNKSKSSDEERWWMGQKCRGIFNIAFTKYAAEEPTGVSIVTTQAAGPTEPNAQPVEASLGHVSPRQHAPAPVRETEL